MIDDRNLSVKHAGPGRRARIRDWRGPADAGRDLEFGGPIRTRRNPVYLGSAEETLLDRVLRYRQRRFEALAPIFLKSWDIHTARFLMRTSIPTSVFATRCD